MIIYFLDSSKSNITAIVLHIFQKNVQNIDPQKNITL